MKQFVICENLRNLWISIPRSPILSGQLYATAC